MIYMLLNIVLQAWIIGSITLLVVKNDENTGHYRDTLERLEQYSKINEFERDFHEDLTAQVILDYENHDVADEQVLSHFPTAVRRKVLCKLYLPYLRSTQLMRNVRQQFVDAFLAICKIEMFRPGEEILQRGNISLHLYLLVGGEVEVLEHGSRHDQSSRSQSLRKYIQAGEFLNEVGFFTDSPQIDTIKTASVCKTLTISRSAYGSLANDHPGSAGKILKNLLQKVNVAAADLPDPLELLRAGSVWADGLDEESTTIGSERRSQLQTHAALTSIQELVEMHISKQHDDHTTTFLFAASRGDIKTVCLMCDQGFDPNSSDYDRRTALMVSAMKGNSDVVAKLLDTYRADPNLADMHGSTALFEAAKNGHDDTMQVLLAHNASLCMDESLAASTLCQAVFDGDTNRLRRLLKAGIPVNAGDYDKRTAGHIAAAEGNTLALGILLDFGADLALRDRWMHTASDEASDLVKEFLRHTTNSAT